MTERVRVGPAQSVVRGEVKLVWLGRDRRGLKRQAIVVRDRAGDVRAYLNQCRHLPIPLDAFSGRVLTDDRVHLVCATHGAVYRPEDGLCIEGPCEGASLTAFEVVVEPDGMVYLLDDYERDPREPAPGDSA